VEQPRLKAHYAVEVVGDEVFLLTEDRHFLVSGAAAVAVLPYLDGTRTVGEIVLALSGRVSMSHVLLALTKFERGGHLSDGRPDMPADELAFWDGLGVDPRLVAGARGKSRVTVLAVGDVDAEPFAEALESGGVMSKVGDGDQADLAVVVVDDYLRPELGDLNAAFLAAGRPWLLVKPGGTLLWLGPLFRPGTTGCWACMRQRLEGNRQVQRFVHRRTGDASRPFPTSRGILAPAVGAAAASVTTEVLEILATGSSPRLDGVLLTVDRRTSESARHVLLRQPQCPACGDPALVSEREARVVLQPQPIVFSSDNGFRVRSAAETRAALEAHISPVLGAITGLASLTSADDEITFAYGAGHDFPMGTGHVELLRKNVRGQSGGKGRSDTQARVSAMAEAIERYCGIWHPQLPVTRTPYSELGPERAVHPHELLLFSDAQYDNRDEWNAHADILQTVPERFHPDCACDWTTAWSLTHDRPMLVPAAHVWFGHPDLNEHFFTICDANGNATGNVLEEAILQGLCELVERDCVATWWYNRVVRPAVDLDSFDDPYVETLRRFYAQRDCRFWMLDISSDLEVPAFAAVMHRVDHPVDDVVVGFGAHPSARIAMMRALTEMNQFLPFIAERDENGNTVYAPDADAGVLEWLRSTHIDDEPWLHPSDTVPARRLQDYPSVDGATLDGTVRDLVARAARAGLDVLVVDQSRPEIDFKVAKVLVPGMRHFWRRLAPGRLYDVPLRLGWLDAPVPEDQLNPKSVFF
jgi:ribosomal protein S12 methylthiotransferase accessory factor